ncbi:MAG: ATP-binding protein [Chitinophagales bacterium]
MNRIAITGPESTGKSVLAAQLAGVYHTVFVPEFARHFLEANGNQFNEEIVIYLAQKQLEAEKNLEHQAQKLLFCDTDMLNFKIWLEYYSWKVPDFVWNALQQRHYSFHLLLKTDLPWQSDLLRNNEHDRHQLFERFRENLEALHLPYQIISGKAEARLQSAIRAVNHHLEV